MTCVVDTLLTDTQLAGTLLSDQGWTVVVRAVTGGTIKQASPRVHFTPVDRCHAEISLAGQVPCVVRTGLTPRCTGHACTRACEDVELMHRCQEGP